ncbi:MAG: hypothetical protein JSR82_22410 [Verrucomicrobia bacterium]|nr:hypothetical protein [Verrucomicrobiota bacterium]
MAQTTLHRVRFFYCSASRDADQTPELARIGYQPRREGLRPAEEDQPAAPASPTIPPLAPPQG